MYDLKLPNNPIETPSEAPDCLPDRACAADRRYRARLSLIGTAGAVVLAVMAQALAFPENRQTLPNPSEKIFYAYLLNARMAVMAVGVLGLLGVGLYLLVRRTRPDLWQKAAIFSWRAVLVAGVCGEMFLDVWCIRTMSHDIFFDAFLPSAVLWTLGGLYRKGMYLHEKSISRPWGRYIGGMLVRTLLLILGMVAVAIVGFIAFFGFLVGDFTELWADIGEIFKLILSMITESSLVAQSGIWSPSYLVVAPVLYVAVALMEKSDFERRRKALSDKLFAPAEGCVYAVAALAAAVSAIFSLVLYQHSVNGGFIYDNLIPAVLQSGVGTLSGLLLIPLYTRLLGLAQTVTALRAPVWGLIGVRCANLLVGMVEGSVLNHLSANSESYTAYASAINGFSYVSFGLNLLHLAAVAWLVLVLVRQVGAPHSLWTAPALRVVQYVSLSVIGFLKTQNSIMIHQACNIVFLILLPVADLIFFSRCRMPAEPSGDGEISAEEMLAAEPEAPVELG